jgi:hypothetical protein
MKKLRIIFISLIIIGSACSEEFLERPPLNTNNADNFWQSEKQVELAVTSVYNAFARPMGYDIGHIVFGDVSADDIDCYDANWFVEVDNYLAKPTGIAINGQDEHTQGTWAVMYNTIFRANWVLTNIDRVEEISDEIYYRSEYEVRFLRSIAYFTLINIFGDVPFYDGILPTNEGYSIERTSKDEIYNFIINELHECGGVDEAGNLIAEAGLPVKGDYELGRATRGAALGLLARVYLYTENFTMAEKIAEQVIGLGTYDLHSDYGANFDNLMTNGIESLWEINVEPQGQPETWAMNPGSWIVSFTVNKNFEPNQGGGWAIIVPDSSVVTLWEYAEDGSDIDQRRPFTIYKGGDTYEYAPPGLQWFIPAPPTYTLLAKYSKRNHFDEPVSQNLSRYLDSDSNIPVLRYSEILLIYAEACYENGKPGLAFKNLNMIRERAGLAPLDGTEDFMEHLIHERRLEFMGEGHRFFDLRRWGMLEEILGPEGYRAETNGLFPIPQNEIDLNSKLLPQNSGY